MAGEDETHRFRLDAALAEYNRCFGEISARFTFQIAAFTIEATGIGSLFAFGRLTEVAAAQVICLFAPLFIAPLGYMFFDNELQIWRVARYMRITLRAKIAALTGDDGSLTVDVSPFGTDAAGRTIPFLSIGRWLIFVVPLVGAAIFAAPIALSTKWFAVVYVLDLAAVALLVAGVRAAILEQLAWRTEIERGTPAKPSKRLRLSLSSRGRGVARTEHRGRRSA